MDLVGVFGEAESSRSRGFRVLGAAANLLVNIAPSSGDTFTVVLLNEAERGVTKLDERSAVFFTQTILHVVRNGVRHKERATELEQSGSFDR